MAPAADAAPIWPAQVIHVNEDGWVLVNRGTRHGVAPGLRVIVVGAEVRELRDLYAQPADGTPVLRIRSTFEQLEVIHAEERCAVAIAARVPAERRPQIYRGPEGELLVWVPLPADFTWPHAQTPDEAETAEDTGGAASDAWSPEQQTEPDDGARATEAEDMADGDGDDSDGDDSDDALPEQQDERWEQALPLNGTNVGDVVLPALPIGGADGARQPVAVHDAAHAPAATIFDAGRSYDWLKPNT